MHPSRGVALLLLITLATSCAGPTQLARESDQALRQGDVARAYDLARRGVEKDPTNRAAHAALAAAAAQRVDAAKARVLDAAALDTVAAARLALDLRDLRAELSRYQVELPDDPRYLERENAIVVGAAATEYELGERSLSTKRPKEAYGHYHTAETFVASYRDLQDKLRRAHELATTRVAVLPFDNDVDVPGLSRAMCDAIYHRVASQLAQGGLQFTELVHPDEVYATMTVKDLDRLSPDAVWRIAGGVDATRIVVGRFHGQHTTTNTFSFQFPIFHKVSERDTSGHLIPSWVETRFDAVARERLVTVDCELQVLDARTHDVLETRSQSFESVARVAWTDFRAEGSCDDYHLVPPDQESDDEGQRVGARWRECFGSWTLAEMLDQARSNRQRSLYQSSYRDEFRGDSRQHPVLCGELPGEDDMTVIALDDAWRPVWSALRALDPKD